MVFGETSFEKKHYLCSNIGDYDVDYRTIDTLAGHDAWFCLCVLHEGRNVCEVTEDASGICLWRDGGGIGMVVADSLDGDGGR